jgi:hypothetical protein
MMRSKKILMTDRSWPLMLDVIENLAEICSEDNITIVFLSERYKSCIRDNLEIINIYDISQKKTIIELQRTYDFSLYKCIVTERSYTDYSSFRSSQLYSRMDFNGIERWIQLYANAFDYIVNNNNIDIYIENAPDCFIPSLGGRIFKSKGKSYYSIHISYWHLDGIMFFDGIDWTSSEIDKKYNDVMKGNIRINKSKLDNIFKQKKTLFWDRSSQYILRIKTIINRYNSYNPPSILNWLKRRFSMFISKWKIKLLIKRSNKIPETRFVLYPLHVSPEASLLGTLPELADQFSLIKNISINLPWGVSLCVKEHPHALLGAGLDFSFYKKISELRNVEIISKEVKIKNLFTSDNFVCLMGLAGTACFEAALLRKHVLIFGNPYFKMANCFTKINNYDEINNEIMKIIEGKKDFDETALYAIMHAINDSVITENVDFSKSKTTFDIAKNYNPIIRKFAKEILFNKS